MFSTEVPETEKLRLSKSALLQAHLRANVPVPPKRRFGPQLLLVGHDRFQNPTTPTFSRPTRCGRKTLDCLNIRPAVLANPRRNVGDSLMTVEGCNTTAM